MTRRQWSQRILGATTLTLLVGAALWYVSSLPGNLALALTVTALLTAVGGLVLWSHTDHAREIEPATWHVTRLTEATGPMSLDYRLMRLRRDLRDTLQRTDREDTIHPLLCDLVVERLRQRHGIHVREDPESARAHLPAELWHYMTHPPQGTARRSAGEIAVMLDHLESI